MEFIYCRRLAIILHTNADSLIKNARENTDFTFKFKKYKPVGIKGGRVRVFMLINEILAHKDLLNIKEEKIEFEEGDYKKNHQKSSKGKKEKESVEEDNKD